MFGVAASVAKVDRMVSAMRRRGPDDAGIWSDERSGIAFGHTRLSIIDLTTCGRQPMLLMGEDGRGNCEVELAVVFNGEIYNYRELRRELEAKGAVFKTHSDTEVILWGWKLWGRETPRHLRGMFAFAIWGARETMLTLVRDRMGIKPLLWCRSRQGIIFASSLKAILSSGDVPRVLNDQGLFDYLLQGAVLQPRTMIRGVWALEPGTMKEFRLGVAQQVSESGGGRYWSLTQDAGLAGELSGMPYEEQVRATRRKLEEACRYHLVADVPVGSFLSGGVDSTAITALMTRLSGDRIKSFSIGFARETGMQDELSEAKIAAAHIGTEHTEVCLSGREVAECFDDFIEALDQPSVDGLNTYWVSQVTREHGIKVALSGLGGDELFAGYDHFRWAFDERDAAPSGLGGLIDRGLLLLYRRLPYSRHPFERCRRLLPLDDSLVALRRFMSEGQLRGVVSASLAGGLLEGHLLGYAKGLDIVGGDAMQQITKYECHNYLVNTLLRDADALSMGHGMEARPIFLDHHLVEYALALPAESKWRAGVPKAILKDATKDLLPPDFFSRRKTGFTLPTYYWVEHELSSHYRDALQDAADLGCFTPRFLAALENDRKSRHVRRVMWQMLVLIRWLVREKVVCGLSS